MEIITNIFNSAIFQTILSFLGLIVKTLIVLAVGFLVTKWALKLTGKALQKTHTPETLHKFLMSLIKIVAYVILGVIALNMLGIPTDSILAAIATCGVAVGLALKDSLSNFASGVLILFNQPFKAGDFIEVGGTSGVVTEVGLMATKLKTFDNRHIIIPNNTVSSSNIVNNSVESTRRLDMDFNVSYHDDAQKAIELIRTAIEAHGALVLNEPAAPFVMVTEHCDTYAKVTVRIWCKAANMWDLKFALLKDVRAAFVANNFSIPHGALDINLNK